MEKRKEIQEFLKKNGISQSKAGDGAGYTGSVVSQYLAGTYKGDVDEVERNLVAWMKREGNRRTKRNIPIAQTEAMTRVINALNIAHEEKDIAVIVGEAGTGKTTALRRYKEENPHGVILIEADKSMTAYALIQEISEKLELDKKGGFVDQVKKVCGALRMRDFIVIIDEAEYLNDGALELARRAVHDKGQSGLVLVGLPRLEYKIRNLKNDHQQLASRIGVLLHVDGIKEKDARAIVNSVWPTADGEVTKCFFKASCGEQGRSGSIRTLTKLMDKSWRTAIANGMEIPDVETIMVAGSMIFSNR